MTSSWLCCHITFARQNRCERQCCAPARTVHFHGRNMKWTARYLTHKGDGENKDVIKIAECGAARGPRIISTYAYSVSFPREAVTHCRRQRNHVGTVPWCSVPRSLGVAFFADVQRKIAFRVRGHCDTHASKLPVGCPQAAQVTSLLLLSFVTWNMPKIRHSSLLIELH